MYPSAASFDPPSFGSFGIYNSSQHKNNNPHTIPSLHVFGNCLEANDEQNRRDIFDKVKQSLATEMRFSHVNSSTDMTHLLTLVRRNPNVQHIEFDSCQLTGEHFGLLPASAKLVSCSVVPTGTNTPSTTGTEQQGQAAAAALSLEQHCAQNTLLEHLQIHDLVLDGSLASSLRSFRAFPRLHSLSLVACHLTHASYASLTAFLQNPTTTTTTSRPGQQQLHSLAIDLRVWSQAAVDQQGLAQAIGSCHHITNLQLNGRILEQVKLPTLLSLLGQSGSGGASSTVPQQQKKKRLRLTFRPDEIQGEGLLQLGQLAKAANSSLQAVDISDLVKVCTLSFFDYEEALASFMETAIVGSSIQTLALPKLSSTLSRSLAHCLSRAASWSSLLHLTSPGIVWSPPLDAALRETASLVYVQGGFRDATTKAKIQHYLVRNQRLPQLLRGCSCCCRCCGLTKTTTNRQLLPRAIAASRSSHVTGVVQALLELGDDVMRAVENDEDTASNNSTTVASDS